MDKENNKLQECFISASIEVFENYYNMVLSIDKKNAKQPEHLGSFSYKGKSKSFIMEKIEIFKTAGYIFICTSPIPEFRRAMGLDR